MAASKCRQNRIFVVVPFTRIASLLNFALKSIFSQTRIPDGVLLVCDSDSFASEAKLALDPEPRDTPVLVLVNQGEKNVSGAINTGIREVFLRTDDPDATYIAILDDDDQWLHDYLEKCEELAIADDADWIITGIERFDKEHLNGVKLSIPRKLEISSFLTGNPHVQGSNMFVRLSKLLMAGSYDENLPSTTDRDICIRLLMLPGLKYAIVNRYLVRHNAYSQERLSSPGNPKKQQGLELFFRKFLPLMTADEKQSFLDRSLSRFHCVVDPFRKTNSRGDVSNRQGPVKPKTQPSEISLVVGVTVSDIANARLLVQDLSALKQELPVLKGVVVCDNTHSEGSLKAMFSELTTGDVSIFFFDKELIERDAINRKFGFYYTDIRNRYGIAYGRTSLHRYLYLSCLNFENPVAWVVDDDIRLNEIYYSNTGNRISGAKLAEVIDQLRKEDVSVAVGSVGGDPPLPVLSTLRTQLLDLLFSLILANNSQSTLSFKEVKFIRSDIAESVSDFYYDLSTISNKHLESPVFYESAVERGEGQKPIWNVIHQACNILESNSSRLIEQSRCSRDQSYCSFEGNSTSFGPVRGGNTLIFDMETLRNFSNASPRLGDHMLRRGDTLWIILNRRLGGPSVSDRQKKIVSIPLLVKQERRCKESTKTQTEKLVCDVLGSAFARSLDAELLKLGYGGSVPNNKYLYEALRMSMGSAEGILQMINDLLADRLVALKLNSWRIRGLVSSIQLQLAAIFKDKNGNNNQFSELVELENALERISVIFQEGNVDRICGEIRDFSKGDAIEFIRGLSEINASYSRELPPFVSSQVIASAKKTVSEKFGVSNLELLGTGKEGIIFGDGTFAYKYFTQGKANFELGQLELVKRFYSKEFSAKHLVRVHEIYESEDCVIFKEELVEGKTYSGGHLTELLDMLRECKLLGIVYKNLAPKNLVVSEHGLVYVDVGRDIQEFSPESYVRMCRRAYLTYRWHFRPDLQELARRSLTDASFPELFGFDEFFASIEEKTMHDKLRPVVINLFRRERPKRVLDYGTGDGWLVDELMSETEVYAYDKDLSRYYRKHFNGHSERVLSKNQLDVLEEGDKKFDMIFALQVLCEVEDLNQIEEMLSHIRTLITPAGKVLVSICNPFDHETIESELYRAKQGLVEYSGEYRCSKIVKETGRARSDFHRPFSWYVEKFENAGFSIESLYETEGIDILNVSPGSDVIFFLLKPKDVQSIHDASLLVKVSAMEWKTVGMQVRHIVRQLDSPRTFRERIVVTDKSESGFNRPYEAGDYAALESELLKLQQEGVIDRFIVVPDESGDRKKVSLKWFGLESDELRSSNGQPILASLVGIDSCNTKYVLQLDSDCVIWRGPKWKDYLGSMIRSLEDDDYALTVSFPVAGSSEKALEYKKHSKYRVEVRNCLIAKDRIEELLPLDNDLDEGGRLNSAWHRSLDRLIHEGPWKSLRIASENAFYIHVPNSQKRDSNAWYDVIRSAELGSVDPEQKNSVDLVGSRYSWIEKRCEGLIIIVRGRNTPISKLRRCFRSLESQTVQDFGVIYVDANSSNGALEYIENVVLPLFKGRMSIMRNFELVTTMENIYNAIRGVCSNPHSVITMLDADDALAQDDALTIVSNAYSQGADVTVGSMIRTDKYAEYPVEFLKARKKRGGNVWQHLRSFRKYLFDAISEEDLRLDGKWIDRAEDWAYMLPIVEMAEDPKYITERIYFYEPSPEKNVRDRENYERTIRKIIGKRSYGRLKIEAVPNFSYR